MSKIGHFFTTTIGIIAGSITAFLIIGGFVITSLGWVDEWNEDRKIKIEMFKSYKLLRGDMNLPFQLRDRVDTLEARWKVRDEDVREFWFIQEQNQKILFGELDFVKVYDEVGGVYHLWQNNAGDNWLVINKIPYIIQYIRSEGGHYYYENFEKDYIYLDPVDHDHDNHPPQFQLEIEESEHEIN